MRFQLRPCVKEGLGYDYGGAGAVGCGAALEFCQGGVDHGTVEDLLEGVFLLELRVGVALGVFVADFGDAREVGGGGAVSERGGLLVGGGREGRGGEVR